MLERFRNEREKLKEADKEDKLHAHQQETVVKPPNKKSKVYFDSDSDGNEVVPKADKISLEEQEALALKLLGSMHS